MRKVAMLVLATLLLATLMPQWAMVAMGPVGFTRAEDENVTATTNLDAIMDRIQAVAWVIAIGVAVPLVIWCGLGYMNASDNPQKKTVAEDRLKHCAIGLVIVFAAPILVSVMRYIGGY